MPVLRQALRVATRPVSVVPSRYGSAGVDHRHPEGEARWRLSSIASDRCNVFGLLPTRPRTLRLDTPEARRRRSFRLLNQGGSHTPFPSPASFLEGTSTPEPNTSTATRPTHRHPGFRTSPGPPSCQCGVTITLATSPVESGGRYPPSLSARALSSWAKVFRRPTNSISLYPPISHHQSLSSRPQRSGEPGSIERVSCWRNGSRIALRASGMTSGGCGLPPPSRRCAAIHLPRLWRRRKERAGGSASVERAVSGRGRPRR